MVGLLIRIAVVVFVRVIFQPLLMCTRRFGVTSLIIVFVSDYMLKNSAWIELLVTLLIKTLVNSGADWLGYCFACDYT